MKRKMLSMGLVILLILLLTGCQEEKTGEQRDMSITFLTSVHANSKLMNYSSKEIMDLILEVISNYGKISIVRLDSNPELIATEDYGEIFPPVVRKADKNTLNQDYKYFAAQLIERLQSTTAKYSEIDVLEGLSLAARTFSGYGDGEKIIVVANTGLSTSGILDFNNNLLDAEPELITEMLAKKKALPQLNGIKVVWIGLGETNLPQKNLSPDHKAKLKSIWEKIIKKSGGEVTFNDFPCLENYNNLVPDVSPVELTEEQPIYFDKKTEVNEESLSKGIILNEYTLGFMPDTSTFIDKQKTYEELKQIAATLKNSEIKTLISGTTAGDVDSEFTKELSSSRAEAVRNALIELGVEADKMQAIGLGSDNPWHVPNLELDDPLSSNNRKVVIINVSSDTAKKILAKNDTD